MTIEYHCPKCNTKLRAQDTAAGKRVACPRCDYPHEVPGPEPAARDPASGSTPSPARKTATLSEKRLPGRSDPSHTRKAATRGPRTKGDGDPCKRVEPHLVCELYDLDTRARILHRLSECLDMTRRNA